MKAPLWLAALALCACVTTEPSADVSAPVARANTGSGTIAMFRDVVSRVEPLAESVCKAEAKPGANCDFKVVVDSRENQPPNAYQSVDSTGRPVLTFTEPLIRQVQNADELAFVMGHEAAHHISGHLDRTQQSAVLGGIAGIVLGIAVGGGADLVDMTTDIGASVGARAYSKSYELEADQLGTVIAFRAGYNPERGAQFFTRIPDPGDRFLGTHPPNGQRIETVRRTMASLR
ncbi:M48 family metallopeptidase [Aliiroseovarius sp. PTFE2010]|uniref:M48 family metallopeptidase n=1 Tax=Aliiroseovarius sp. PTFE2010 TaxID=3417190 RepID=UPI003CF06CA9